MKKYISLIAAAAVMLSMAGCAENPAVESSVVSGGSSAMDIPDNTTTGGTSEPSSAAVSTTTGPATAATEPYKGMEIVSNSEPASEVTESKSEDSGFSDGLFGGFDDALDYAVAEEGVADGTMMDAPTAAPSAPAEAPFAPSGDSPSGDSPLIDFDYPIDEEIQIKPEIPPIQPQAGLLTGGEWRDNNHWYEWISLYQSHEDWNSYRDIWRVEFDCRREIIVTAGGVPVEGAEVRITYPDVSGIDTAVTDNNGRAYLFVENTDEIAGIDVTYGDMSVMLDDVSIYGDKTHNIELREEQVDEKSASLDLMLMVDTTGSMMDELCYLQAELQDVIRRVAEDNGNIPVRTSVNFYRDEGDEYIVRYYPFTEDSKQVSDTIAQQEAMGGGDFPEAVHSALDAAINQHEWNEDSVKLMFLVLDAPPHEDPQIVDSVNSLVAQAAAEGIRIIPVASSGIDKSTEYLLRTMAFSTGGTYTFLTDDSGIGGAHLEPTIGEYQVESLNDMMVRIINDYLK